MSTISHMQQELQLLEEHSNLRRLPRMVHDGRDVIVNGKRMLNLSSNDYLGLASDRALREEFLRTLTKSWKPNWHAFSARKPHWCSTAGIMPTWASCPP